MSSSDEAVDQLNKWHKESTRLFMSWAISTAHGWSIGTLKHSSSAELHFGIEGIDGRDFLFVVNVHSSYRPRFRFLDARDGVPFFSPRQGKTHFGKILEIALEVDRSGESKGRVVFAEFFLDEALEVGQSARPDE